MQPRDAGGDAATAVLRTRSIHANGIHDGPHGLCGCSKGVPRRACPGACGCRRRGPGIVAGTEAARRARRGNG
eukprot:155739-Chlamydomonas_euryale.AAC.1